MYCRQHFEHNILIYGIHNNRFCVAGYNERQHFSYFEVPKNNIIRSKPQKITLLTLREDYEYRLDRYYIIKQLKQFINMEPVDPVGAYKKDGQLLGLDACEELEKKLINDVDQNFLIELRPFYLVRDHCRVMLERMRILLEGTDNGKTLVDNYAHSVKKYEIFLLSLIKYNLSKDVENKVKIQKDFQRWIYDERRYICQFIAYLEREIK